MDSRFVLSLSLLCSLQVCCQAFPRLSFGNNDAILNHGYVDLGMIGTSYSNSIQCRTDLETCCTQDDSHRGNWYFPDGDPMMNSSGESGMFYESWKSKRVDLRCNDCSTSPPGIYRCEIPTNAVHDDTDISVRATVYVGLYISGGKFVS